MDNQQSDSDSDKHKLGTLLPDCLGTSMLFRSAFIFIAWIAVWQLGRLVEYTPHASVWFPAAGFSFACLLVHCRKAVIPIMLAAIVITIWNINHYQLPLNLQQMIWAGILFGLAHILPYWLGAACISTLSKTKNKNTPQLIISFLLVTGLATLIATVLVIMSLVYTKQVDISEVNQMLLPFWIGDLAGVIVLAPLFTGVLNKIFPTSYVKLGVFYTENLGSFRVLASKISINLVLITFSMLTAYVLESRESAFAIFFLAVTHMWIACTESPAFNIISLAISSLLIVLLVHILGLMDHVMVYQFAINVIAANALFGMAVPQLMADNKALKSQVYTDTLTQVSSRHFMMKQAEQEINQSHQTNTPLTLVVFDLDNFKQINDLYGHMAGDKALQQVSTLSKKALRSNDMIARFGGDEFVLLLPGLNESHAQKIVERIKHAISTIKVKDTFMSSSFGMAELKHNESFNGLFKRADKALYHSKAQGGNQIKLATA